MISWQSFGLAFKLKVDDSSPTAVRHNFVWCGYILEVTPQTSVLLYTGTTGLRQARDLTRGNITNGAPKHGKWHTILEKVSNFALVTLKKFLLTRIDSILV